MVSLREKKKNIYIYIYIYIYIVLENNYTSLYSHFKFLSVFHALILKFTISHTVCNERFLEVD